MATELCVPVPEFLIKSIAEQGYTLETSIADLIDNSISAGANKIEVLIDSHTKPFRLFIADNGCGMTEKELKQNMQFPSSSLEAQRDSQDLGRFGLGLKTASFAQTRRFTVITKKKADKKYKARTWDVQHLKDSGKWEVIVNTEEEINALLINYNHLSNGHILPFSDYEANTIIVWDGLYKFEKNISGYEQSSALQKELTETTKEHLQLIFHRFMEKADPLRIRLNNEHLSPFNPFPSKARQISTKQKSLLGDKLKLEGYVLPNTSIAESKGVSPWTLTHKSLMDMEGMYIYRADRIIVYGGWNGAIKKSSRLQLARLKVEIGNGIDHLFHLNVAKSSIIIPYGERIGFMRYVSDLKSEAEKEFFNFQIKTSVPGQLKLNVFKKIATNQGMAFQIDEEFPVLNELSRSLNKEQNKQLKIILRMVITHINKIKRVHTDETYAGILERDDIEEADIAKAIDLLIKGGVSKQNILSNIIPAMGINPESLSSSVLQLLH